MCSFLAKPNRYFRAKKLHIELTAIILSNVNRFSKFFNCKILQYICSKDVIMDPTVYTLDIVTDIQAATIYILLLNKTVKF